MSSHRLFKTMLMAALCVLPAGAFAQQEETELNPIKWSIKVRRPTQRIELNDPFVAELTAQIDKGWHLYSTEQVEGGPKPTRITFPAGQAFEQAGAIDAPAPNSSYDPNFRVETEFYEESVTFAIPFRALPSSTAGVGKVVVEVRYQTCTQAICLPPKLLKLEASVQLASTSPELPPAPGKSSAGGVEVGAEVPDFDFTDFSGKARRFGEYRGRYVLIDFWATWCGPCLADIPHLKELYLRYHALGFEIIGMDSETLGTGSADPEFAKETQAHAREIIATRGVTWTQVASDTAVPVAVKVFGVASLPTKILVDPHGRVVARIKESSELDKLLGALLGPKP